MMRRRRLSRARRERSLQDYRVDERARQRACRRRKKKKAAAGGMETADFDAMSRTGLQLQSMDLHRVVQESVDIALGRSRAALIRQLTAFLKDNSPNRGQVMPVPPDSHAPAYLGKCLRENR